MGCNVSHFVESSSFEERLEDYEGLLACKALKDYRIESTTLYRGKLGCMIRGAGLKKSPETDRFLLKYCTKKEKMKSLEHEIRMTRIVQQIDGCVRIKDVVKYENEPLMILKYGGRTLYDFILNGSLNFDVQYNIMMQLATTFSKIHSLGIVHKDIHPNNITYQKSKVTVIDFGSSTLVKQEYVPSIPIPHLKNLEYMAPETTGRMNRMVDLRSDIYSLGCTFYQLVTGQLPFPTVDNFHLIQYHLTKSPVPPHKLVKIPIAISAMIMKMMEKEPDDRYSTLESLLRDLENWESFQGQNLRGIMVKLGKKDSNSKLNLTSKLFGKEKSLSKILSMYQGMIQDRQLQLLSIDGPSGVGKTTVVRELAKHVTSDQTFFVDGTMMHYHETLSAFSSALTSLVQEIAAEGLLAIQEWRTKFTRALQNRVKYLLDIIPNIELITGSVTAEPEQMEFSKLYQRRVYRAIIDFLVVITADRFVVMFLDNFHLADQSSLKLLHELARSKKLKNFLLIIAHETSKSDILAGHLEDIQYDPGISAAFERLSLHSWTTADINLFLKSTLKDSSNCRELAEYFKKKTAGNAFHCNVLLKDMYSDKQLVSVKNQWEWKIPEEELEKEDLVRRIFTRMKEAPDNSILDCLSKISIIGHRFPFSLLQNLMYLSDEKATLLIEKALDEKYILRLTDSNDPEFKFYHETIYQAVSCALKPHEKTQFHFELGKMLRDDENSSDSMKMSYHFNESKELARIYGVNLIDINYQAGKKALRNADYENGLLFFERSLEELEYYNDMTEKAANQTSPSSITSSSPIDSPMSLRSHSFRSNPLQSPHYRKRTSSQALLNLSWKSKSETVLSPRSSNSSSTSVSTVSTQSTKSNFSQSKYPISKELFVPQVSKFEIMIEILQCHISLDHDSEAIMDLFSKIYHIEDLSTDHQLRLGWYKVQYLYSNFAFQEVLSVGCWTMKGHLPVCDCCVDDLPSMIDELKCQCDDLLMEKCNGQIEKLIQLPEIKDPLEDLRNDMMIKCIISCGTLGQLKLFTYITYLMLKNCLECGRSPLLPFIYASLSVMQIQYFHHPKVGYELGQLAVQCCHKTSAKYLPHTAWMVGQYSVHIGAHVSMIKPFLNLSLEHSVNTGSVVAAFSRIHFLKSLVVEGVPLSEVVKQCDVHMKDLMTYPDPACFQTCRVIKHFSLCLMGVTKFFLTPEFEMEISELKHDFAKMTYHYLKMLYFYLDNHLALAMEQSRKYSEFAQRQLNQIETLHAPLIQFLIHFQFVSNQKDFESTEVSVETLKKYRDTYNLYFESCSMNVKFIRDTMDILLATFVHKQASDLKHISDALKTTAELALSIDYKHMSGVIYDFIGKLYEFDGKISEANEFFKKSGSLFFDWGYTGRKAVLEATALQTEEVPNIEGIISTGQTLAEETHVHSLIEKTLEIMTILTKADRACVLLPKSKNSIDKLSDWHFQGEHQKLFTAVMQNEDLSSEDLPLSVIKHVLNTKKDLIIDDVKESPYKGDLYFKTNLKAKSVVCHPLMNGDSMEGIFIFFKSSPFSAKCLPSLKYVALQIIVPMKNSRLHAILRSILPKEYSLKILDIDDEQEKMIKQQIRILFAPVRMQQTKVTLLKINIFSVSDYANFFSTAIRKAQSAKVLHFDETNILFCFLGEQAMPTVFSSAVHMKTALKALGTFRIVISTGEQLYGYIGNPNLKKLWTKGLVSNSIEKMEKCDFPDTVTIVVNQNVPKPSGFVTRTISDESYELLQRDSIKDDEWLYEHEAGEKIKAYSKWEEGMHYFQKGNISKANRCWRQFKRYHPEDKLINYYIKTKDQQEHDLSEPDQQETTEKETKHQNHHHETNHATSAESPQSSSQSISMESNIPPFEIPSLSESDSATDITPVDPNVLVNGATTSPKCQ